MWRDDVMLHRVSVLHTLAKHNIGHAPEILAGDDVWLPPESRARLDEAVNQDLAGQRLLTRDRLDDDFYDVLNVIARPAREYFGWVQDEEYGNYALSVAGSGRSCVLVLRRGNWVRFMPAQADRMAETWLDQIRAVPAGGAASISLPEAEAPWVTGEPCTPEARRFLTLLDLPRFGGGQVHARSGTEKSAPLTYLDTTDGRWLLSSDGDGRDRWITAAPGTPAEFARKMHAMV
ncbi:ESX secretion-associated protein EspG [Saccharomonospora sp. NPDC046836]|uniref:ESX secretion-associated protein EspG n=1 Tax=Saccharomonospora sp. NPDC046836 TaxID=3156921 RepID=UPI0033F74C1B